MNNTAQIFNGSDYVPVRDNPRLTNQIEKVFDLMKDATWRTLAEISYNTDAPEASVSAQLRHLRKDRFGGHTVEKRYDGGGLYSYALLAAGPLLSGER